MNNIFFTSDWHIGHKRILELCPNRPYADIAFMASSFFSNALQTLDHGDTLVLLGDDAMGLRDETLPMFEQLRAAGIYTVKLMGNHCYGHPVGHRKHERWMETYKQHFDECWVGPITYPFHCVSRNLDVKLLLNHFPSSGDHHDLEERGKAYRRLPDPGEILLHGHTHSVAMHDPFRPRELHVGIDADWRDYGVKLFHPIPIEAIIDASKWIDEAFPVETLENEDYHEY